MDIFEITIEMKDAAEQATSGFNVNSTLHPNDELLRYIIRIHGKEEGIKQYFRGGRNNALQIKQVMDSLTLPAAPSVLEFASGFGRVTRHLGNNLSGSKILASDIHNEGCEFIRSVLNTNAIVSSKTPETLGIEGSFDFIFVLSLFSHLPDKSFGRWLKALYDLLNAAGFLLVTANGQVTMQRRPEFWGAKFNPDLGYGYARQSDQLDLDPKDYGSMAISLRYMADQIDAFIPEALLYSFKAGAWFGHQDEWIFQRPSQSDTSKKRSSMPGGRKYCT